MDPITRDTQIIIRGAGQHFAPPAYKSIMHFARRYNVGLIVLATPYASHGLAGRLRALRRPGRGDPYVSEVYCFYGDWGSFWRSATDSARPTAAQKRDASRRCGRVISQMRVAVSHGRRVLVLCHMGRNRSFALAFLYYLFYYGHWCGYNYSRCLAAFKRWRGVNFDRSLQRPDSYLRVAPKLRRYGSWGVGIMEMVRSFF